MKRDALPPQRSRSRARTRAHTRTAPGADAAGRALPQTARTPYSAAGRWAWCWAQGKLACDPVFRGLLEQGQLQHTGHALETGCGQGLLARLLHGCAEVSARGDWPLTWPAAPAATAYTGIDLLPREIRRAQAALHGTCTAGHTGPRLVGADMRQAPLPACDRVVILDVLHCVDDTAHDDLPHHVRAALAAGCGSGRLLLRVGDAAHRRGFVLVGHFTNTVTQ